MRLKKKLLKKIALNILFVTVAAIFLTWFLEYRYYEGNVVRAWDFIYRVPLVFLWSSLIMATILIFFYAIFRTPFFAFAMLWSLLIIFSYINIQKIVMRGTPVLPEDFQLAGSAGSLTKFISIWPIVKMAIAIAIVIVMGRRFDRLTAKILQPEKVERMPWWVEKRVLMRVFVAVLAFGGFMLTTDFARNHEGGRYDDVEWLNTRFTAWNQSYNYNDNGFLLGFLYNLQKYKLAQPDDYSEEKIAEISEEYAEEAVVDEPEIDLAEDDINIVMVLAESFIDVDVISDYYDWEGGEVTPVWREITQKYPSGYMYSTDYGGGTANIEFEVFTGLSNHWANTVPFTDIFPKLKTTVSVASFLKTQGYTTTAVHPFSGAMYKRDHALTIEGYDEFITIDEMEFTEHDGQSQYINDRSAYQQVLKLLEERDDKQMIELVTMQNHAPYDSWNYDNYDFTVLINEATGIEPTEESEEERQKLEVYLQTLHNSDQYLGEFLSALDEMDEKTVVLFFGDHEPSVFSAVNSNEDAEVRNLSQLTPYFIYSNFELPGTESAGADVTKIAPLISDELAEAADLPTTTPNCLSNTLFNILNSNKPKLNYLLDDVCADEPVLTDRFLGDKSLDGDELIHKYELVTYDVLGGKQYWLGN